MIRTCSLYPPWVLTAVFTVMQSAESSGQLSPPAEMWENRRGWEIEEFGSLKITGLIIWGSQGRDG